MQSTSEALPTLLRATAACYTGGATRIDLDTSSTGNLNTTSFTSTSPKFESDAPPTHGPGVFDSESESAYSERQLQARATPHRALTGTMMLAQDHAGSSHTATGDRTVTEGNLTFPLVRGSDELLYKFTGSLRHPEAVSEVDSGAQGATSTVTLTTPPEMQLEHPLNLRTCTYHIDYTMTRNTLLNLRTWITFITHRNTEWLRRGPSRTTG